MTEAPDLTQPPEDSPARAILAAALAASEAGDPQRAVELFERASAAAPAWGLPHFLAGSEFAAMHDWESAEKKFARAVALEPTMDIARYQYGLLLFTSGKADAALVVWQPLIGSSASAALGFFARGFAAVAADDFRAARTLFESGLRSESVNAAMASDVYKMLEGMAEAERLTQRGAQNAAALASGACALEAASHVLVANYDKLKLH